MNKKKKFKMVELLGVISTVLGLFKGLLLDLPFQLWMIIILGSFTIYWVGKEGVEKALKEEKECEVVKTFTINA